MIAARGSFDAMLAQLDERQRHRWVLRYTSRLWREVASARRLEDTRRASVNALEALAALQRVEARQAGKPGYDTDD